MKHETIRNHKDFFATPDDVNAFVSKHYYFLVKTKSAKEYGNSRYGVVATKKKFRLAVDRNRAKRLLRDWIAFSEDIMVPDLDYIVIANSNILDCDRETGRKLMHSAFKKVADLYNNNVKPQ